MKNIRDVALQTHTCLYSRDNTHQRNAIRSNYSTKAEYNDPLVSARGWREIEAQFRALKYFSSVSIGNVKIYECNYDQQDTVVIESVVTFVFLWLFTLPLKIISKYEFDASGRVSRHTDIWSVMDILSSIFFFGWFYNRFRRILGTFLSRINRSDS
jgi:hypothetical protein